MTSKRLSEIAAEIDAEVAAEMAATREQHRDQRHARDLSPEEYEAKLAELKRGPKPEPMPVDTRSAKDMTPAERTAWMAAHRRKFQ